ncbi:hypothetical protein [Rhodoferax sp. UBA5149]|uniref:hypothetical protein n=1 Tax=Rhodoferax sp. UBA5149 TaxID=1947379 RepID=UPI0025DDDCD8|nr:hypothetical protein [Rhodoferax sp. UBA5149]
MSSTVSNRSVAEIGFDQINARLPTCQCISERLVWRRQIANGYYGYVSFSGSRPAIAFGGFPSVIPVNGAVKPKQPPRKMAP